MSDRACIFGLGKSEYYRIRIKNIPQDESNYYVSVMVWIWMSPPKASCSHRWAWSEVADLEACDAGTKGVW